MPDSDEECRKTKLQEGLEAQSFGEPPEEVPHPVRRGLRHAPRTARGAKAAALAAERQQLVVAALAAAQPQETMRQDSALQEGFELVLDEPGQLGARAGLGVGDEAGRVLLHQAVQRALLGTVALITERAVGGFAPSWQRESGHGAASKYCAYTQYLGATVSDGEVDRRDAGKLPVVTVSSWPTMAPDITSRLFGPLMREPGESWAALPSMVTTGGWVTTRVPPRARMASMRPGQSGAGERPGSVTRVVCFQHQAQPPGLLAQHQGQLKVMGPDAQGLGVGLQVQAQFGTVFGRL